LNININYTKYLAQIEIVSSNGNVDIGCIGGSKSITKLIYNYKNNKIQLQPYKNENIIDIYLNDKYFTMKVYLYKNYNLDTNEWKNKILVMNKNFSVFNYIIESTNNISKNNLETIIVTS
jgi:hypothetical protein